MMAHADVLDLFNCMVVDTGRKLVDDFFFNYADKGVVTDFAPTYEQSEVLLEACKPLDLITLFTREERESDTLDHLLVKQILHYIEVYGLDAPGLFNLEVNNGQLISMRFVQGITRSELAVKVQELLYTNAPIKDTVQLRRIIYAYDVKFNLNEIKNNEMRVLLYNGDVAFDSGDDAVRLMCQAATGETLLIKSPEVIKAIGTVKFDPHFFVMHELPLAQVFNRHKKIILAAKNSMTAHAINRIARKSKTRHVPIKESVAKTFVHRALLGEEPDIVDHLGLISLRDKFKFLNLLAQKKLQSQTAAFKIRNGKVHIRTDRRVYDLKRITQLENCVLDSLNYDLKISKDTNILLDRHVDYGLPISRKQTLGNLPFGTKVTSDGNEISSGMYWENDWGATDLDLSTIDMDGKRVGWGGMSGYNHRDIIFSGDVTDARHGAVEFMTSRNQDYGLFVNIYSGKIGSKMELVVGSNRTKDKWIDNALIREKHTLNSSGSVIGFVKGKTFVVYAGRLNNKRISGADPIINESRVDFWTLGKLFSACGVNFDVDRQDGIVYDHDLSYESFSLDKLEELFKAT
jgi:hypothetical protein